MTTGSIANGPLASAGNYADIAAKVSAFLQSAKAAAADGLTWREFGELLVALLRVSIDTLDHVRGLSGADKKAIVLEAVASLFDLVADKAVPTAAYPLWFVARPAVRSFVLALASGAVEQVLPLLRAA